MCFAFFLPRPWPLFSSIVSLHPEETELIQASFFLLFLFPSLAGCPAVLTDSEDESPEDMRLPPYGLCEHGDKSSSPAGPREASPLVVISQPAPIAPHLSGPAEDNSSDSVSNEGR